MAAFVFVNILTWRNYGHKSLVWKEGSLIRINVKSLNDSDTKLGCN